MSQEKPTKWIEQYHRDGVFSPLRAMKEKEASSLLQIIENIARDLQGDQNDTTAPLNFWPWLSDDHPFTEPLMALAQDPSIVESVQAILGPNVVLRTCDLFFKRKSEAKPNPGQRSAPLLIQWHWDDPRNQVGSDGMLTVWIALTPSTPQNGGIRFIPGSHTVELERKDPLDRETFDVKKKDWSALKGMEPLDAELLPGEFSLHHGAAIHGSTVNNGQDDRCGIALRYASPEVDTSVLGAQKVYLISGAIPENVTDLKASKNFPIMWWDPNAPINIEEQLREAQQASDEKWSRTDRSALEEQAEAGDADSQFELAIMYLDGIQKTTDATLALQWFTAAADQGHGDAFFQLGKIHERGVGVEKDPMEAISFWKKGAEVGNAESQYTLGQMLARGRHIPKDVEAAAQWFKTAAEIGHGRAQVAWGQALVRGQGTERNREAGYTWLLKAAEQGMSSGQAAVGIMLRKGKVVGRNTKEATRWLELAAESGHSRAQLHLGQMLLAGEGCEPNLSAAEKWFLKAHENRLDDAESWLDKCRHLLSKAQEESSSKESSS